MSLVADYASSSGSDSESEAETSIVRQAKGNHRQHNLLASQDTSSSSDSDSVDSRKVSSGHSRSNAKTTADEDAGNCPLPLPQVFSSPEPGSSGNSLLGLSVFANPFEQARRDQLSILEKHVKLKEQEKTDNAAKGDHKVCYKFQKGKCRFGDTCKFSHGRNPEPAVLTGGNPGAVRGGHLGAPLQDGFYHHGEGQRPEEEEETIRKRRKDRAGLSETLIPSKKAMRIYDRQRTQERPWTEKR